jgi:hypothetical protein
VVLYCIEIKPSADLPQSVFDIGEDKSFFGSGNANHIVPVPLRCPATIVDRFSLVNYEELSHWSIASSGHWAIYSLMKTTLSCVNGSISQCLDVSSGKWLNRYVDKNHVRPSPGTYGLRETPPASLHLAGTP